MLARKLRFENEPTRAEEMAQWLRALVLAENLSLIP